jgi:tetratricopeptide (TPR) repeat protein
MKKKYDIPDHQLNLLISLLLILAIIVAYGQVRNFDFVDFDDGLYVAENSHVQEGLTLEGLVWAFTTYHSANWHPLTWLSHMLDCELYGLNPMGHHWTNLQLHMANTLLLFFILKLMTGAIWRSAFVAALFALHPLHVESVAWVSERKDVLSTFFGMLMIAAYYRYVKRSGLKNYLLVIILLSLGLMAKPMLVTFPFVLLLLDYWPLKRFQLINKNSQPDEAPGFVRQPSFRLFLEKVPLFIPVVISSILTFSAQQGEGALVPLEALPIKIRFANALISYVSYVLKAIWPRNLAVYYPHPVGTLPVWQICGAALLIAVVAYGAISLLKRHPYVAVGMFWYFGTLIPVIGLVQVSDQAMADRYTYIPLTGLFIVVTWGVSELLAKWHYRKIFLGISAVVILSALTACTFFQASHWKNTIALFENAVKVTENNYRALNNLGTALVEKGKNDEAILHFAEALRINPKKTDARNNLANVLFIQGKYGEAISLYYQVLKTNSEHADAHYNLAYVLSTQGRLEEAVVHYKEALRINPENEKAHFNLGNIWINQGKIKEAMAHLAEAIRISPDYAEAYNKIGLILFQQGKYKKAGVFFSKAIQVNSNFAEAHKNLIKARTAQGNLKSR